MTKWEYTEVAVHAGQQQAVLQKAGAEGWELAGVLSVAVSASPLMPQAQQGLLLIFKRPKAAEDVAGGQSAEAPEPLKV